jgi:serine/threonine protein kinase
MHESASGGVPPGIVPVSSAGTAAQVRTLLAWVGKPEPAELPSLLAAHQRRLWRGGERIFTETYLKEVPALQADERSVLDLLANEIALRHERGERPRLQEYLSRFPQLANPLQRRFPALAALADIADGEEPSTLLPPRLAATPRSDGATPPAKVETASPSPCWPAVPGYEILGELGRGGMGVVYQARQTRLKRLVALKMVRAGAQASAEELARFRREAEAVARLQHPNIVQIYEINEHEGRPYFSLEFAESGSLAAHLDGTPLPPRPAARFVETLARAIEAAHQAGVVHRDLKPANVLLRARRAKDGDGPRQRRLAISLSTYEPKITDFGLAKRLDSTSGEGTPVGAPLSGGVFGTPSYMAPEQAGGRSEDVGPAADVYALGAMLYELLTGRPPFRGATALDTVLQVLSEEPVPPTRLQRQVPRDLETICLKCLQKNPRKRYATAEALADDLHRFHEGRPILARPVAFWERAFKWARRRPAAATIVGLACLAPFGILGETARRLQQTEERRQSAADALEAVQADLYFSHVALAAHEWEAGRRDRVRALLDTCSPHFRAWEWSYLNQCCRAGPPARAGAEERGSHPRNGNQATRPVAVGMATADGGRVAWAGAGSELILGDATDPKKRSVLRGHQAPVTCVAFRPDGERVASGSRDQTIKIWDVASGQEVLTLPGHQGEITALAYGGDGNRLASAAADGTVRIWDGASGQELFRLAVPARIQCLAFHPQGLPLVLGGKDGFLGLWEQAAGAAVQPMEGAAGDIAAVAFGADGRLVVSGSQDGTVQVWNGTSRLLQATLIGRSEAVLALAFTPDGRRLATGGADGTVTIWVPSTGREILSLSGPIGPVLSLTFDAKGRRLLAAGAGGKVHVWEGETSP